MSWLTESVTHLLDSEMAVTLELKLCLTNFSRGIKRKKKEN